jgi:hypothetical protein
VIAGSVVGSVTGALIERRVMKAGAVSVPFSPQVILGDASILKNPPQNPQINPENMGDIKTFRYFCLICMISVEKQWWCPPNTHTLSGKMKQVTYNKVMYYYLSGIVLRVHTWMGIPDRKRPRSQL